MFCYTVYYYYPYGLYILIIALLIAEVIELGIPMLAMYLGFLGLQKIDIISSSQVFNFWEAVAYAQIFAVASELTGLISIILQKIGFIHSTFLDEMIDFQDTL